MRQGREPIVDNVVQQHLHWAHRFRSLSQVSKMKESRWSSKTKATHSCKGEPHWHAAKEGAYDPEHLLILQNAIEDAWHLQREDLNDVPLILHAAHA